jgi:two-component system, response regulator PdtaR
MQDRISPTHQDGDKSEPTAEDCHGTRTKMAQEQTVSVRIALAEDEPDIRRTFVRLLELLGHEVIFAVSNGAELLEQQLEDNVDVVFVDLDMPVMDGLAAAEEVERKGIPVILVSGHPDSESVVIDEEPVVTRITKPASLDRIQEAIALAMASRREHTPRL